MKGNVSRCSQLDFGITEHKISVEELCQQVNTHVTDGLSSEVVKVNGKKYGYNIVTEPRGRSRCFRFFKHILKGVSSLMFTGVIVCTISFLADLIGDVDSKVDLENVFLGMSLIIFITVIGTFSYAREMATSKILIKSVALVTQNATVVRGGHRMTVDEREVVVGDLVELKYGDEVPADIRVIESRGFQVDTAPLTGISVPKLIVSECTDDNPLITRNMIYESTYAVEGFCRGIVVQVGDSTVLGRITGITSQLKEKQTPLAKDVTLLILTFTCVGVVLAIACWVAAMRLDYSWSNTTVFFVGICVATVPEALLAAIKVCHYVAAKRLLHQDCIAKRFDAIENLGATTVLCIDKTGTLTGNKLAVTSLWAGTSLNVVGNLIGFMIGQFDTKVEDLVRCIRLTCKATVRPRDDGTYAFQDGEPVDIALLKFAYSVNPSFAETNPLQETPFNYRTFYQLSIHLDPKANNYVIVVRGAPERVFDMCSTILINGEEKPVTAEISGTIEKVLEEMAQNQARVIGFCDNVIPYREDLPFTTDSNTYPTSDYRFLGLVSVSDPVSSDAAESIAKLRSASIKIVMLTGDHPETARAVGKAVGILTSGTAGDKTRSAVFTGSDLKSLLANRTLGDTLRTTQELIFARLSPEQKAVVIEAFQEQGELVTMVGDGLNDCAAMRAADTSVCVRGSCGAAKAIADIVVPGNRLMPVVQGIAEGRLVFENMKKCFAFTISSNIPKVMPFFLFVFLGIPLPISPISIIVLTIGVDMLPATSLAYEPSEWDLMTDPVHKSLKDHKLFSGRLLERSYARIGITQFVAGMFGYTYVMLENGFHFHDLLWISEHWYSRRVMTDSVGQEWTYEQRQHVEDVAQTVYFYAVALFQLVHLLGCKMRRESIFCHIHTNWRLILALLISLTLLTVVVKTQLLHFIETSRIESIPTSQLLPAIPFAVFIFIYDEFRRLILRTCRDRWIERKLNY